MAGVDVADADLVEIVRVVRVVGEAVVLFLRVVQQKAELYELERSLNAWKRKVEIAEMEAKRTQAMARKGGIAT